MPKQAVKFRNSKKVLAAATLATTILADIATTVKASANITATIARNDFFIVFFPFLINLIPICYHTTFFPEAKDSF